MNGVTNERRSPLLTDARRSPLLTDERRSPLSIELIEKHVWPRQERRDIWMIADAARDRRIYSLILSCHLDHSCLYTGAPPELENVAPYLIRLDYQYRDTYKFLEQGWGNSWGILLRCDARMERIRSHLRRLLTVRDARGKRMLFRYYDPRVLRIFLPTCVESELREVFGPIECFWTEAESGMTEFQMQGSRLIERSVAL
jgi:Domain of unknown function (DUF4123)